MSDDEKTVKDVGDELGSDAGMLVAQILTASAQSVTHTTTQLWQAELKRRMLVESQVIWVRKQLEKAHMGSAREYEAAVGVLWEPWIFTDRQWLDMHPDIEIWREELEWVR